ncbi:MAG: hypothetical protein IH908_07955 [Proteobacteria bacterium]|nr:hypothetical protein [Pseudomonadota bacterium]
MNPKPMRPSISKEYGVPENTDNLLPWSYVETRMTAAEHYWLSTVAPDHLPHTRPIDGMWLNDGLYFGGSVQSRWRKNPRQPSTTRKFSASPRVVWAWQLLYEDATKWVLD